MNEQPQLIASDLHHTVELSDPQLLTIFTISWFAFWWWIAKFIKSFKYKFQEKMIEDDFVNRICSSVHGTMSLFAAIFVVYNYAPNYPETINNLAENRTLLFSISYFIYDTFAMRYYGVSSLGIETHHLATIGLYLGTLYTGHGGRLIMIGLIVAECSNLFMHVRKLLDYVGLKYTKLRSLLQGLYFGFYICFRGVGGPYILYLYSTTSGVMRSFLLFACYLILQSFYMFPMMVGVFLRERKVSKTLKKMEVKVKKFWLSHNPKLDQHLEFLYDENDDKVF